MQRCTRKEKNMLDVLVVGGGPAGYNAGLYAKRGGLSVAVIEKMVYGAGQISLSNEVDNYLGLPGISGYELGEAFRKHILQQGVEIKESEVAKIEKKDGIWEVALKGADITNKCEAAKGRIIKARTIIYAAGAAYRHLPVNGEEEDIKKSVSYCAVCDGAFCKGKDAAVVGGGNTALEDALYLSKMCRTVYLIHRRKEFRGSKKSLSKLRQTENVKIITEAKVTDLKRQDKDTVLKLDNGQELVVNRVFAAIGMVPKTELVPSIINLDSSGYIIADETGKTSEPGFFAAGDVRTKELRQVITAASDGANAAFSAQEYIESFS